MKIFNIFKKEEPKFCKDCKWFIQRDNIDPSRCINPIFYKDKIDYIHGGYLGNTYKDIFDARFGDKCGIKAKLWEAK